MVAEQNIFHGRVVHPVEADPRASVSRAPVIARLLPPSVPNARVIVVTQVTLRRVLKMNAAGPVGKRRALLLVLISASVGTTKDAR
jgi:hypothetical protein